MSKIEQPRMAKLVWVNKDGKIIQTLKDNMSFALLNKIKNDLVSSGQYKKQSLKVKYM